MTAVRYIDRRFYPTFEDDWDAGMFRDAVATHLPRAQRVLDFGAGRGLLPQLDFRGPNRRVAAVDVDPIVLENPLVDEARVLDRDGRIPFEDGSFDVVAAHNVLEHLPDPAFTFREIHRVLKPGGVFISKTPNRHHYMPTIARMTPHWFHVWVNKLRGRDEHDTFPTVYRCNTRSEIERLAAQTGFEVVRIDLVEGRPEYLRLNTPFYIVGLAYERLVNKVPGLDAFRSVIFATLRKASAR